MNIHVRERNAEVPKNPGPSEPLVELERQIRKSQQLVDKARRSQAKVKYRTAQIQASASRIEHSAKELVADIRALQVAFLVVTLASVGGLALFGWLL